MAGCVSSLRSLACLLLCAACTDTVALGSECPPLGATCRARTPRAQGQGGAANGPEAGTGTSAGGNDGGGAFVPDGQVDVPAPDGGETGARFPRLENPSLEMTYAGPGSTGGGVLSSFAVLATPWASCSAPGFGPGCYTIADLRANFPIGAPTEDQKLAPTDGMSLVNASPDGTALAQTLGEPLQAGARYAFMVDLASTTGATDLSLEVQGGTGPCFSPEPLATVGPAIPGVWTSFCVRFQPSKDYGSLVLSVSSATASTGTRLFIDNLRSDPRCD